MSRLIDADNLMEYVLNLKSKTIGCNEIARFPTAADIVRCNECKNYSENIIWEMESRPQYFCTKNNHYCKDDWYCAGGERRQKGEKE